MRKRYAAASQIAEDMYEMLKEKGFVSNCHFQTYNDEDEYIETVIRDFLDEIPQVIQYYVDVEEVSEGPWGEEGYVSLAFIMEADGFKDLGHENFIWSNC